MILRSAIELADAVALLDGFKDSSKQLIALRELEDEGDRLVRDAVAGLFRSEPGPDLIIRWKDIHERLEAASTPARTRPTCSRRSSSRTAEPWSSRSSSSSSSSRCLRLHERLPRHGERGRDLGLDAGAVAAARRPLAVRRQPRGRLRHDRGRQRSARGSSTRTSRRADDLRGAARRDRLEPGHVVARPARPAPRTR